MRSSELSSSSGTGSSSLEGDKMLVYMTMLSLESSFASPFELSNPPIWLTISNSNVSKGMKTEPRLSCLFATSMDFRMEPEVGTSVSESPDDRS